MWSNSWNQIGNQCFQCFSQRRKWLGVFSFPLQIKMMRLKLPATILLLKAFLLPNNRLSLATAVWDSHQWEGLRCRYPIVMLTLQAAKFLQHLFTHWRSTAGESNTWLKSHVAAQQWILKQNYRHHHLEHGVPMLVIIPKWFHSPFRNIP